MKCRPLFVQFKSILSCSVIVITGLVKFTSINNNRTNIKWHMMYYVMYNYIYPFTSYLLFIVTKEANQNATFPFNVGT